MDLMLLMEVLKSLARIALWVPVYTAVSIYSFITTCIRIVMGGMFYDLPSDRLF